MRLYERPLRILSQKLAGLKTSSGKPVRLLFLSAHTATLPLEPVLTAEQEVWKEAAQKTGVTCLDLNDEISAMSLAFFPLDENYHNGHLSPEGHLFFSLLLAHHLIRDGFIPWDYTVEKK